MGERIWDPFLSERDRHVLEAAGYGQRAGFLGRPALFIIDVSYNFAGDRPEPIFDAIKRWPNACGEEGWIAIEVIQKLLAACRSKGLPVIYSTNEFRRDGFDLGGWAHKHGRMSEDPEREAKGNEIVAEIAPAPRDIVVRKQKPSPFHGTALLDHLVKLKVDSLLVCGTSTSGCVRAAVIDAFSYNFRCIVVEDACFDRTVVEHAINLLDMDAKYADVVASNEVLPYVATLPEGLFELPGDGVANL